MTRSMGSRGVGGRIAAVGGPDCCGWKMWEQLWFVRQA